MATPEKTLQERIEAKHAAKTVWDTDKKNWEYISIPEENALGEAHCSMGLNQHQFDPGQTYLVPPEVARTLKDRLKVYAKSCVRVLQPKRDYESENQVATGSTNPGQRAATHTDPSLIENKFAE